MSKRYQWDEFSSSEQMYLQYVSGYFRQTGAWPTYKQVERDLRQREPNFDFDETVKSLDAKFNRQPNLYRWEPNRQAVLNVPMLYHCPDMDAELDGFMKLIRYCVGKYDGEDAATSIAVQSTELFVNLKLPQLELCKAAVLLKDEGIFGSFDGDPSSGNILNWSFTIADDIRSYRNVQTVEQYIAKRYGSVKVGPISSQSNLYASTERPRTQGSPIVENTAKAKEVFVVHGHDEGARESVARYLQQLGLHPVILHEQANQGMTIIEKFERHSDVSFAVVLLTPDDLGATIDTPNDLKPRARQNVILEWGYFVGQLGRGNVCALKKQNVELPSDMQGLLWIEMDGADGWQAKLAKELKEAGMLSG